MPAITVFVIYHTSTGEILRAHTGKDDAPPAAPADHAVLDAGQIRVPNSRTHSVDLGPPVTLVAKSNEDMIATARAARVVTIEESLGSLDVTRDAMALRSFDVTAINQRIADLEAERLDLLP